jgi:predicted ATPase/class 3 adenylate cyclase
MRDGEAFGPDDPGFSMSETSIIAQLLAYLPPDRAAAILGHTTLPKTDHGAVLFSDISGFTPLTEAVFARFGPRRGGEYFTDKLNAVYDALISEVVRFGGSIICFAGDAMFVWFAGDDGAVAVTAAVHLQRAMEKFARVELPDGGSVSLGMKVAVATGKVRRFAVGDPKIQRLDILAGAVMEHVAVCEGAAARGEIIVDADTVRRLGTQVDVREWRRLPPGVEPAEVAVVAGMRDEVPPRPRAPLTVPADARKRLLPWLVPEVGRRIVSGQDVFLTELRPATVMFVRFTGIDFERDASAPANLDAYVRWLQRIISQLEGVLLQIIIGEKGNYFYAAWGAPLAHDDDTMRACTAALEIVHPPKEIAAFLGATHVGVTRGTMRTGAYGSDVRRTYGVMGDDTNLAARLMAKAGAGEILVSSHAASRQMDMFELQELPPVLVKGKKEPVPVFRLLSRRQTGILSASWSARHATPMIGRKSEFALAVDRLQQAREGRGQVIAISADAGMGKTRLLTEVVGEASTLGFAAFAGDCPVLAREASYSVWIPIWRSFFQVPPGADAAETLAIVERELIAHDPKLAARAPLLGPLLNVQLPENDLTRTLDPKVRRSSLEGLVVECIRHRVHSGPLLFVLEECHWIDEASRTLLASLVRAVARFPVAIVLAHRPVRTGELLGANEYGLDYVTTIPLGNMPENEARKLVEFKLSETFGAGAAPAPLVDLITSRADGNPFFIEEVVNLLKARGTNPRDPRALASIDLPESLHSLVLGRIDQLTEDARSTLKVASVIGRQFRTAVLFGVHPLERVRAGLAAQLNEMQTRDIALPEPVDGEDAYLFKHIVIQEVAYESLPYGFRGTIHETIGRHLERMAGDNVRPWLDLLAFHYDRSNCEEKKRHYLVVAGDAAREAYALPSAVSYFERALALLADGARVDVLARFGDVLELAGRWNDAAARYREARDLAERLGLSSPRAAMAGAIGDLHRKRGEFTDAETWIGRARQENAEIGNDAGVALMLHLEGTLSAQTGKFGRAAELYQQALSIRERLGADTDAARSLNNLGIVSRAQGEIDTALGFYERSLTIRRRLNDRREIANSLNNLGFIRRFRKEYDLARELLEESVQLNRAVGDRWSTANALSSLAELALDTADAALAHRCLAESITINRELGDRRALAFLLEGFGRLGRLKDAPATALMFFAAARALRETIGAPLEPADAKSLDEVIAQTRQNVPAADVDRAETEGRALPLGDVLDRAMSAFG